jgi:AcrR family transcriptional regulator
MKGPRKPAAGQPRRGRPPGTTAQGVQTRAHLYQTAIELFVRRGYEATTLRQIAARAGVSVGLLYRYFPSKRAVILELYERLSDAYAARAAEMSPGRWGPRFLFALRTSLEVLAPQRRTLAALIPALLGDSEENLFAPGTAASRRRVQRVFEEAVTGASDAPDRETAAGLGRMLYLAHLGVLLWWLLDKSPQQRATTGLLATIEHMLPAAALALELPQGCPALAALDTFLRQALLE